MGNQGDAREALRAGRMTKPRPIPPASPEARKALAKIFSTIAAEEKSESLATAARRLRSTSSK